METLSQLGLPFSIAISSAHRSPERTARLVAEAERDGTQVFICAAGMAAHLAGAVAALTVRPVIAIPVMGEALNGMDALLSTVQMPSGFPVATMAINGAKNAALLAAQILALQNPPLGDKLMELRREMRNALEEQTERIKSVWEK